MGLLSSVIERYCRKLGVCSPLLLLLNYNGVEKDFKQKVVSSPQLWHKLLKSRDYAEFLPCIVPGSVQGIWLSSVQNCWVDKHTLPSLNLKWGLRDILGCMGSSCPSCTITGCMALGEPWGGLEDYVPQIAQNK